MGYFKIFMKYQFLFLLMLLVSCSKAQNKHQNLNNKIAIQGYDPVAYFVSEPTEGNENISSEHKGAVYYFSSEENKTLFLKNPSKYEPQYGGYCAFAIGENAEKVSINPKTFKIIEDKLYLFYNAYFNNTLKSWNKDEKRLKAQADKNWNNIIMN